MSSSQKRSRLGFRRSVLLIGLLVLTLGVVFGPTVGLAAANTAATVCAIAALLTFVCVKGAEGSHGSGGLALGFLIFGFGIVTLAAGVVAFLGYVGSGIGAIIGTL